MISTHLIVYDGGIGMYHTYSDKCIDGKDCDELGDVIFETEKGTMRERDFKHLRKFSTEFRLHSIREHLMKEDIRVVGESCSCSRCGESSKDKFESLMFRL